jgi:N-acetylglucosamine kinase-like BadF-type ATPase
MIAPGEKTAAIGIDLGGTKTEAILLSVSGMVLLRMIP